jgi:nitroreductase/NAD-dependent dihydropyrimidine dehydrogenase PreA subunit
VKETFEIDVEKCLRDGLCADECPRILIRMTGGEGYPVRVDEADGLCTNCGHCVAICPTGALSLRAMPSHDLQPVEGHLLPTPEQAEHLLRTRRSIRAFERRPVPRETLAKLIDMARHAPSASNGQPVKWIVVHDSDVLRRLAALAKDYMRTQPNPFYGKVLALADEAGADLITRGAPNAVIVHTPRGFEVDGAIALAHADLAAHSLGLGACWCRFFNDPANNWPPLRSALGIPDDRVASGTLLLGYPRHSYARVPTRNEPKVTWL